MNTEKEIRRYCRQVRSWLPCSCKEKKEILEKIGISIADYRDQNPGADFPAIEAHFGTPQAIAASYVDMMDTAELLRKLRIRRRITAIVLILAAIILVTWLGTVTWAIITEIISSNGTPIIEPPVYN